MCRGYINVGFSFFLNEVKKKEQGPLIWIKNMWPSKNDQTFDEVAVMTFS